MTLTRKDCNLPNKMIWLQITITTKYQRINTQLIKIKTNKYTRRLRYIRALTIKVKSTIDKEHLKNISNIEKYKKLNMTVHKTQNRHEHY